MNPKSPLQSIESFGILPNSHLGCASRINAVLAAGHTNLAFAPGVYLIEQPLRLPSQTHLTLQPDTVLRLMPGAATTPEDYLLTNANPMEGNHDISLQGGTFDGNQLGNPRPEGLMTVGYSGAMIHFRNVRGLRVSDATFTNAEAYYARLTQVYHFEIENIQFDSQHVRNNNDGIHLGGHCGHGVIRNLSATTPSVTGDDLVALNADDALYRTEVRGMLSGDIHDITIENLHAHSCHSFVRLLSVYSTIRDVTIRGLKGGCTHAAINADGARGCRVQVFDESIPPFPGDGVGLLRNIRISDCFVHQTKPSAHALIDIQERVANFHVSKFERNSDADRSPESPTLRLSHLNIFDLLLNGEPFQPCTTLPPACPVEFDCPTIKFELNCSGSSNR